MVGAPHVRRGSRARAARGEARRWYSWHSPRACVAALSLLVLSAGCGGGSGSDGGSAERSIDSAAQERAEAIVLQLDDLPDGWRADERVEDDESDREFRRCLGADYSDLTIMGEASSPHFAMGEVTQVSSEVVIFASEEEAAEALAALEEGFRAEEVDDCFRDLLADAAGEDFEIADVQVGELSFTRPDVADASAWQIAIDVEGAPGSEGAGLSATVYIDMVVLQEGDANATVATLDVLTPLDSALRDELVETVAGRLSE